MRFAFSAFVTFLMMLLSLSVQAKERIVSIGGDVTEIIYALGAQAELVGRDSTSNQPSAIRNVKNIGYMRQLNTEGILSLKPTIVITSDLAQPSAVLDQIKKISIPVVCVSGKHSLQSIPQKVDVIANTLHREKEVIALKNDMNKIIASIPSKPLSIRVIYIMAHNSTNNLVAGRDSAADAVINVARGNYYSSSNIIAYLGAQWCHFAINC